VGGLGPALVAQGVASTHGDLRSGKPIWRVPFNVGRYTLSMLAAGAASRTAERLAGLHVEAGLQNSAPIAHPHLRWLGDIPWPGPLPNVLSVGAVVIYAGTLVLLHWACRRLGRFGPRPPGSCAP
jgi:hypothetical protein